MLIVTFLSAGLLSSAAAAAAAMTRDDDFKCMDYEVSVKAEEQLIPYFPKEHFISLENQVPTSIICKLTSEYTNFAWMRRKKKNVVLCKNLIFSPRSHIPIAL